MISWIISYWITTIELFKTSRSRFQVEESHSRVLVPIMKLYCIMN